MVHMHPPPGHPPTCIHSGCSCPQASKGRAQGGACHDSWRKQAPTPATTRHRGLQRACVTQSSTTCIEKKVMLEHPPPTMQAAAHGAKISCLLVWTTCTKYSMSVNRSNTYKRAWMVAHEWKSATSWVAKVKQRYAPNLLSHAKESPYLCLSKSD